MHPPAAVAVNEVRANVEGRDGIPYVFDDVVYVDDKVSTVDGHHDVMLTSFATSIGYVW